MRFIRGRRGHRAGESTFFRRSRTDVYSSQKFLERERRGAPRKEEGARKRENAPEMTAFMVLSNGHVGNQFWGGGLG